jgi:hypothetical protein
MRTSSLLLVFAACFWAGLTPARASLIRAMDLAELTSTAEQVVVADVTKVDSQWDPGHRNIVTTVEIAVQESWKGTPPANGTMVLHQLGGSVGEIEMTVIGMPRFSVGDRALLFLQNAGVVGMGQGKRPLRWDESSQRWMVDAGNATGVIRVDGQGKIRAQARPAPESLDSLRSRVQAILAKAMGK